MKKLKVSKIIDGFEKENHKLSPLERMLCGVFLLYLSEQGLLTADVWETSLPKDFTIF